MDKNQLEAEYVARFLEHAEPGYRAVLLEAVKAEMRHKHNEEWSGWTYNDVKCTNSQIIQTLRTMYIIEPATDPKVRGLLFNKAYRLTNRGAVAAGLMISGGMAGFELEEINDGDVIRFRKGKEDTELSIDHLPVPGEALLYPEFFEEWVAQHGLDNALHYALLAAKAMPAKPGDLTDYIKSTTLTAVGISENLQHQAEAPQ